MSKTFDPKKAIFKVLGTEVVGFGEEDEDFSVVWRCFDCGASSEKGDIFNQIEYFSPWYGTDYDSECDNCGSVNTGEEGSGAPRCPNCLLNDWYCWKCNHSKCGECWEWFGCPDGEPEEYVCEKCYE